MPLGLQWPIPVAAQPEAYVCGRSISGTAGSNPTEDKAVSCEYWVLSGRDISRSELESYQVRVNDRDRCTNNPLHLQ